MEAEKAIRKLTNNFSLCEFSCKDENNTSVPEELMPNVQKLADNLQVLRDKLKCPIHINSGYRTPEHNKTVGGEKNSFHLKGMAADITVRDKTPKQVKAIIENLIRNRKLWFGGIGLYKGFVHVDIRKNKARW